MAGYSNTPLPQKLGLKAQPTICLLHAPPFYSQKLLPLSFEGKIVARAVERYEWIQAFYTESASLEADLPMLKEHLTPNGQLWISWPKKAAKMATDLDENIVREYGLHTGLVDVKVAAVDDIWSGLKFVFRLSDRG
jgi:hypothetical protein